MKILQRNERGIYGHNSSYKKRKWEDTENDKRKPQ